jgi:hypothetical protein
MSNTPLFDLEIAPANERYTARVLSAYAVGDLSPRPFVLPLDLTKLPEQRHNVAQWVEQARTPEEGDRPKRRAEAFGRGLFEALFTDDLLACFRTSRAKLPRGSRLRLRLRLPIDLAMLPWELLWDPLHEQFLALAPDITLIRHPATSNHVDLQPIEESLRVVVVLASPSRLPPIDPDRELSAITSAFKTIQAMGHVVPDVIHGPGTLDQLRARLREPIHILHVLCHGVVDVSAAEGVLVFEDDSGDAEPVSADRLRDFVELQRGQLRLVVLNSCQSALPVDGDIFGAVGAELVRAGVAAVVAAQFDLPEDVSAELTRVFYQELAAGLPVELALTKARQNLAARSSNLDWVVPVLLSQSVDEVAFALHGPQVVPTPELSIDPSVVIALKERVSELRHVS